MVQIIGLVVKVVDFDIHRRRRIRRIRCADIPDDIGIIAVIRIVASGPGSHIGASLPFTAVVMDAGVIAVGLVIRRIESKACPFIHFRADVGIAPFIIPFIVDFLLPRQLKAPLVLFVEVFRFRVAGRAVPADDVFQIAVENAAFEASSGCKFSLPCDVEVM